MQEKLFREFQGFGQAKLAYNGSILGSSQFILLSPKMLLDSKVVKIDQKIINNHLPLLN